MNKFFSKKRTAFFEQSGLPPIWDSYHETDGGETDYAYMLYTCHKESEHIIREIQQASVKAAEIFDLVTKRMYEWDEKQLESLKFSKKYRELLKGPREEIFCMRIGWALKDGHPTLFETNAQAPVIWIEPEAFGPMMTKHFGLRNPQPLSNIYLKKALNQAIKKSLSVLPKERRQDPTVGFVCYNAEDELTNMRWLAQFCDHKTEVFPIENLDFTLEGNIPFNRESGQTIDALLLWYPLDALEEIIFANGEHLWDVLINGFQKRSFSLVHAAPAFFAGSKSILSYITEHAEDIFTEKYKSAEKYFPKTYLSPEKLGNNYIAKPIFGGQGQGCYIVRDGKKTQSRYLDKFFTKQEKIYQELLTIPLIPIEEEPLNWVYESWVYRVNGKFVPGGISLRGCNREITDDFCYFMPIGI
jgi:glutathionylspermidine synthase